MRSQQDVLSLFIVLEIRNPSINSIVSSRVLMELISFHNGKLLKIAGYRRNT